jgi:ubiquinone/menaquinone biosynthesis C-methylase UbiE
MTVVDFGCGPGFFTLEAARMVGEAGHVVAVDLQEGMLERLGAKLESSDLKARITLHKCDQQALGVSRAADFVLAVYVIHELPEGHTFFAETRSLLNPGGHLLIVEPIFHVSKRAFAATVGRAEQEGLTVRERPRIWLSRAALLQKA